MLVNAPVHVDAVVENLWSEYCPWLEVKPPGTVSGAP